MIRFYSTGCPMCNQLKSLMDSKKIDYDYVSDIDTVMEFADKHNIKSAPFAEVFDEIMTASQLLKYINTKQ